MTEEHEKMLGIWGEIKSARTSLMDAQNEIVQILSLLEMMDVMPDRAHLLKPEELKGHGHGYLELNYIGDDEDAESFDIYECVWLNGWVFIDDGCGDTYSPKFLAKWYNRRSGVRVWDSMPTDEQRGAGWNEV